MRRGRGQAGVLDEDVEAGLGEEFGGHQARHVPDRLPGQGVQLVQARQAYDRGDQRRSRGTSWTRTRVMTASVPSAGQQ